METRVYFKDGSQRTFRNVKKSVSLFDIIEQKPAALLIEDFEGNEWTYTMNEIDFFSNWSNKYEE